MRDGILILNKPQKWTSSDCVAICRRALKCKGKKKVGHGGTLDPMATGVLPIFVGQATRIMEYLDIDSKTYRCTAKLGLVTDTLDIWGEEITSVDPETFLGTTVTEDDIRKGLEEFVGDIEQIPPKYSAVRINGKRLYEYAYEGQEIDFEIKPRKVHIDSIDVIYIDMDKGEFQFDVSCSKGTYIRTICHDLGQKLGCGCIMTGLVRTVVGNLTIDDAAISAEDVKNMSEEELEKLFIPSDYPLTHFGEILLSEDRAVYFSRGNSIRWRQVKVKSEPEEGVTGENARGRAYSRIYNVYHEDTGEYLGTGYYDQKERLLKADKVFVEQR